MNETHLPQARLLVRRAADQLAEDSPMLTAASAEALKVGLEVRVAELRCAVVAAWRAGASREELAQDARVKIGMIEDWVAAEELHPRSP